MTASLFRRRPARSVLVLCLGTAAFVTASPAAARTQRPAPPASTWAAGEAGAARCVRDRRKLWQAHRGWVVKSVKVCQAA